MPDLIPRHPNGNLPESAKYWGELVCKNCGIRQFRENWGYSHHETVKIKLTLRSCSRFMTMEKPGIQLDPGMVNWREQKCIGGKDVRVQLSLWSVHYYIRGWDDEHCSCHLASHTEEGRGKMYICIDGRAAFKALQNIAVQSKTTWNDRLS